MGFLWAIFTILLIIFVLWLCTEPIGILLLVIVLFVAFVRALSNTMKEEERESKRLDVQQKFIVDNNIVISSEIVYKRIRVIIDEPNKIFYISEYGDSFYAIPFSEIIGCEILTDSEVTGRVGRAIVGGMIAGDVGAVVGAATAKKQISSYTIRIYRKNIQRPTYEIPLIRVKIATEAEQYKNAVNFADKINASIKAIISMNP